ncbi:MAG: hypothetical protein JWL72_3781 [Ilumatobacteraceae bacterium]|nr:hypothetical protein [Ilumatobacteraceae bacterium]MCU1390443.1 hypothetical protein [Ilumatobacteraceae bacterium]
MNKLIIGSMAVALSFGAVACSSDSKTATTTTSAAASDASTGASSDATTAASTGASGALGTKQAAVLAKTEASITAAGLTYDADCLSGLIGQLTDADADLILAQVPPATVTASPAGEAIGKQIEGCVASSTSGSTAST